MSYRDYLARRGLQPVRIERTVKHGGDKVLDTWARPARDVPAWVRARDAAGRFARKAVSNG